MKKPLSEMTVKELTSVVMNELEKGLHDGTWDRIKAASKRRRACPRHLFEDHGYGTKGSERWRCSLCDNSFGSKDVLMYEEGFRAAGGDVSLLKAVKG